MLVYKLPEDGVVQSNSLAVNKILHTVCTLDVAYVGIVREKLDSSPFKD